MGNHHSDSGSIAIHNSEILPKYYNNLGSETKEEENFSNSYNHYKKQQTCGYNYCHQRSEELCQARRHSVPSNLQSNQKPKTKCLETPEKHFSIHYSDHHYHKQQINNVLSKVFSSEKSKNAGIEGVEIFHPKLLLKIDTISVCSTFHSHNNSFSSNPAPHISNKFRKKSPEKYQKMPTIQINGQIEEELPSTSALSSSNETSIPFLQQNQQSVNNPSNGGRTPEFVQKQRAQKVDSRKMTAYRRQQRSMPNQQNTRRRLDFLASSSTGFVARSLDETGGNHSHFATDLQRAMMKPLSVCHWNSPLKQMRTYSYRSVPSEENVLSKEHGEAIRLSWKLVNERILHITPHRCFGYFVLDKVLEKSPDLKTVFDVAEYANISNIPETHSFHRHIRLFNSIIDLAVRNVDELETEIAPALFTYGKRHYTPELVTKFNEESVRMFCEEIVHTMLDLLGDELTADMLKAWIEMIRYMGTALLSGFEYERMANKKKISINTRQHAYFVL